MRKNGLNKKLMALLILLLASLAGIPATQAASGVISLEVVNPQETNSTAHIEVSNGGLLGMEGDYSETENLSAHLGDTLYFMVVDENGTKLDYTIVVDGKSIGETNNGSITHTVDKTDTFTVKSSPDSTSVNVTVEKQEGLGSWLAKYVLMCKSLPALLNMLWLDTLIYAVAIVPIGAAIGIKILIAIFRAILSGDE